MPVEASRHLRAVRSVLRERQCAREAGTGTVVAPVPSRTPAATPVALRALPATGGDGLVELLWHERRVESFGLTHRIAIPLAGRAYQDATADLAALLSAWWAEPGRLSNGTVANFVSVELIDAPLTPPELAVTVTTAAPATEAQVANLRTIRDLRRALRDLRRETFAQMPVELAVV